MMGRVFVFYCYVYKMFFFNKIFYMVGENNLFYCDFCEWFFLFVYYIWVVGKFIYVKINE